MRRPLLAALVLLAPAAGMAATDLKPAASLAAPLDNQGPDARSQAMGTALMGLRPEASAQLWNPAGLARLASADLSLHHHSWLADILQESVALGLPLGDAGTAGATVSYTGFGSFERRGEDGQALGSFDARRLAFGLAWAREFGGELAVGLGLRGFRQDMADWSMSGQAMDLGGVYRPLGQKALALGVSAAGIGATGDGSGLAGGNRLAATWEQPLGGGNAALLAFGALLEPRGANRLLAGCEISLAGSAFVRAGWQQRLSDEKNEGLQGLALGLGARVSGLRFDYAWLPQGELGVSHRLSVSYAVQAAEAGVEPQAAVEQAPAKPTKKAAKKKAE